MKKLFLLFLLLTSISTGVQAQTFSEICSTGQELEYRVLSDPKTVEVKKVTNMGASSNVIIPEEVSYEGQEYAVTAIGEWAFAKFEKMASIILPPSVTSIGDGAFSECGNMTAVFIPNSVTEIGHEIFANCHSLQNVVIANDNPAYQLSPTDVGDSERILLIDKRTGHEFEAKGDIILRDPEVRAMFPGGVDSLKKFLNENVKLSPRCIEVNCVVILEFVVETDGSITSINVLSSYCGGCQEYVNDAVRLVKAMPKWDPAQDDGQPCRSYYQLPITYCLR